MDISRSIKRILIICSVFIINIFLTVYNLSIDIHRMFYRVLKTWIEVLQAQIHDLNEGL